MAKKLSDYEVSFKDLAEARRLDVDNERKKMAVIVEKAAESFQAKPGTAGARDRKYVLNELQTIRKLLEEERTGGCGNC